MTWKQRKLQQKIEDIQVDYKVLVKMIHYSDQVSDFFSQNFVISIKTSAKKYCIDSQRVFYCHGTKDKFSMTWK